MRRGLAFDAFGRTEDLARQAAATVLAMFTISGALSVPRKNVGKMAVNLEKDGKKLGQNMETIGNLWCGKNGGITYIWETCGKHMGNIWEKLRENIERWEKCGEHGQKCGKTYGNHFGQNLRRITNTKGKQWENICDTFRGKFGVENLGKYRKEGYMWEPCGKNVAKPMANM